jgi:hypothetical protein
MRFGMRVPYLGAWLLRGVPAGVMDKGEVSPDDVCNKAPNAQGGKLVISIATFFPLQRHLRWPTSAGFEISAYPLTRGK